MKNRNEKLEILAYMVENGYSLGTHTIEDYCRVWSVAELWRLCAEFLGEDPTA